MGRMAYTTIEADVADDALGSRRDKHKEQFGIRDVQRDIFDLRASQNYSQGAIRFRDIQRGHIQFEPLFARSDPITRCPTRTRDQPEPYAFASQRAIGRIKKFTNKRQTKGQRARTRLSVGYLESCWQREPGGTVRDQSR